MLFTYEARDTQSFALSSTFANGWGLWGHRLIVGRAPQYASFSYGVGQVTTRPPFSPEPQAEPQPEHGLNLTSSSE